jgi:HdeA/HdeB family
LTRALTAQLVGAVLLTGALAAPRSHAVEVNLAAVTCATYQSEVLTAKLPGYKTDSIDTVMWLFGFSVAKSGERVMYGDSLTAFGFALDAECKNNPDTSLFAAVTAVKSKREHPMDLTRLDCATFEPRHVALRKSDPENANTLTLWLFGYSVGLSGSRILDPDAVSKFDAGLEDWCTKHPEDTLFDALAAPNPAIVVPKPAGSKSRAAPPGAAKH